ncbi:MAG: NADH-quinone oxidoreductase subunit L [Acidobacteriota bacterium]
MLKFAYLIILFPFIGFLINGLLGRRQIPKRWVGYIACGAVFLSFLLSVWIFVELNGDIGKYEGMPGVRVSEGGRSVEVEAYEWVPSMKVMGGERSLRIGMNLQIDPLSSVMVIVVSLVGFLIHVYSIGYMWEEGGYYRYFAFLNLFMGMMLTLVLAGNFAMMFIGWEGVGLCSYLLIGFFFEKEWCADAGRKAFIVNRIGDFGFMIGLLLIVVVFGTLDISDVMGMIGSGEAGGIEITLIGILLFIGAIGKSAQIPLYVWLPDAMAGPTPVSALIHAATMVTAGVYMVSRCAVLYVHAPAALTIVAVIGGLTAIYAASIGLMQNDIKKVLAYSTVSQLGYMFLGAGVAAFGAAIFHLMTHAFFKALLFLGSGSVIHGRKGEQDIRKMGGLKRHMPVTHVTFLLGALAIAGIPGFSGFFSKEEILFRTYVSNKVLWLVGLAAAGMTAFYMMRLVYLTFYGKARFDEEEQHVHEAPRVMTYPLVILAIFSVIVGYVGIPKVLSPGKDINYFEHYLEPSFEAHEVAAGMGGEKIHEGEDEVSAGVELMLMVVAVIIAIVGIYIAWEMYLKRPGLPGRVAGRFMSLYRLISNKYWVDELYDAVIVQPYYFLCRRSFDFDTWVIDGTVNGVRHLTVGLSHLSSFNDKWVVDGMVNILGYGIKGSSWVFRKVQTGLVQSYATVIILGTFILLSIFLIFI